MLVIGSDTYRKCHFPCGGIWTDILMDGSVGSHESTAQTGAYMHVIAKPTPVWLLLTYLLTYLRFSRCGTAPAHVSQS